MAIDRSIEKTVVVASMVLIMWLSAPPTHAADQPSAESGPFISTGVGVMASGAVEDTLKACLSRIPGDASVGQRMIAEESCQRDEMERKVIQIVPGAYATQ
jgi:hypothetical protein